MGMRTRIRKCYGSRGVYRPSIIPMLTSLLVKRSRGARRNRRPVRARSRMRWTPSTGRHARRRASSPPLPATFKAASSPPMPTPPPPPPRQAQMPTPMPSISTWRTSTPALLLFLLSLFLVAVFFWFQGEFSVHLLCVCVKGPYQIHPFVFSFVSDFYVFLQRGVLVRRWKRRVYS